MAVLSCWLRVSVPGSEEPAESMGCVLDVLTGMLSDGCSGGLILQS